MEDSGIWISPSKSTASPRREENNENDSSQFKINPNSLNQKEKPPKPHFMSPTISASSKAATPRRKILSERNQNSFEPYSRDIEPKKSPINSSGKAYNPLTNYLSPRPKYLRYNPNSRMEIFSRLEKEELSNDSFDSQEEVNGEETGDSCFCPSIEDVFKPENEVNNVEDEEDEEIEEEKGWNFNGLLKFLLVLIAFVFSTSYICTMNSPMPTPGQQAILTVKDGYYMVKRQTLEVFRVKGQEGRFLEEADHDEFEEGGFFEEVNGENEDSTEGGIIEDGVEIDEVSVNVEAVENDVGNLEVVEIGEVGNRKNAEDSEEFVDELDGNETEDSEDKTDEVVVEVEGAVYVDQFDVKGEDFDRSVDVKTDDIVVNAREVEVANSDMEPEPESYEQLEMEVTEGPESIDQNEVKAGDFAQMVDTKTDEIVQNDEKIEAPDSGIESEPGRYEQSEMEIKGPDQFHEVQLLEKSEFHEIENNDNLGRKTEAFIGVSLITVILASLGFIYRLKKSPRSSILAEKSEPVVPKTQNKRKIEFFAIPSLLQQPTEQAPPEKLNHHNIYAPSVELMGEIVVGQMSRRGIRKYGVESTILPQPSVSTSSSLSYGGFKTETKILKKEGGQSGEFTVQGTPVRRSSRLRNRAAVGMSP